MKAAFYGLRPVITGLVLYGAYRFADSNGMISTAITGSLLFSAAIFALSLGTLIRGKLHPVYIILLSGLVGMAIYG